MRPRLARCRAKCSTVVLYGNTYFGTSITQFLTKENKNKRFLNVPTFLWEQNSKIFLQIEYSHNFLL